MAQEHHSSATRRFLWPVVASVVLAVLSTVLALVTWVWHPHCRSHRLDLIAVPAALIAVVCGHAGTTKLRHAPRWFVRGPLLCTVLGALFLAYSCMVFWVFHDMAHLHDRAREIRSRDIAASLAVACNAYRLDFGRLPTDLSVLVSAGLVTPDVLSSPNPGADGTVGFLLVTEGAVNGVVSGRDALVVETFPSPRDRVAVADLAGNVGTVRPRDLPAGVRQCVEIARRQYALESVRGDRTTRGTSGGCDAGGRRCPDAM